MKRIAVLVGWVEAAALVINAISIVISGSRATEKLGSPVIEAIIFVMFAAGIIALTRGVAGGRIWARTPYFLLQVFTGIIAYTVFSGDGSAVKIAGSAIGVLALLGVVALSRTPIEGS